MKAQQPKKQESWAELLIVGTVLGAIFIPYCISYYSKDHSTNEYCLKKFSGSVTCYSTANEREDAIYRDLIEQKNGY